MNLFSKQARTALLSGKPISFETENKSGYLVLDRTHGTCVCSLIGGVETPLFNSEYLEATIKPSTWKEASNEA